MSMYYLNMIDIISKSNYKIRYTPTNPKFTIKEILLQTNKSTINFIHSLPGREYLCKCLHSPCKI